MRAAIYGAGSLRKILGAYINKAGCPTPMNDKVVEIIHMIEKGELKSGLDNLQCFK